MDLYTYVAESNPYQAKALLHKHGYSISNVRDSKDLGVCLKKLVQSEGEVAFLDILECHPDKGVILEAYTPVKKEEYKNSCGGYMNLNGECSCNKHKDQYMNASGNDKPIVPQQNQNSNNTSFFILAAALLLAAAIIVKK